MSSPYARSSSSGGSPYAQHGTNGGVRTASASPSKKKRGGILGTIERIPGATVSDIGAAATGFLPGTVHAAGAIGHDVRNYGGLVGLPGASAHPKLERPKTFSEIVEPQAKAIAGDIRHPLRHPFYTFQDALAALSLGTGAAARAGLLSRERAVLETRSPRAINQGEGPVSRRLTETAPLSRGRQRLAHKAVQSERLYHKPVVGEAARYGKEIRRQAGQQGRKLTASEAWFRYLKARRKLNSAEKKALNIIPRGVHPADIAAALPDTPNGLIAADPKVAKLVLHPTPRLARAVEAGRQVSELGADVFKTMDLLGEEQAAARPSLYHGVVSEQLGREARKLPGQPYYLPDEMLKLNPPKNPFAGMGAGKGLPRKPGTAKFNSGANAAAGRIDWVNDVLGREFLRRGHLAVHRAVFDGLRAASIRKTPAELDAIIKEHGGIPKDFELLSAPVVGKTVAERPQRISQLRRMEADVFATPQSLVAQGLDGPTTPLARRVLEHTAYPDERAIAGGGAAVRTQDLVPEPGDIHSSVLTQPFGTRVKDERAYFDGHFYYLAPKSMVRAAAGEFHRSSALVRALVEKPLQVWRAVILGLRVGFFTNNVVGNHIIYAMRTAGIGGLRAYINSLYASGKDDALIKRLINQVYVPDGIRMELMREFFPDQIEGTFGHTQSPATEGIRGAVGERAARAKLGIIPATQAVAESVPRRALVEAMIRDSPEFKAVYKGLPKQSRSFDKAARQLLAGKGGVEYQRLISDQVNQALGDYLNLSPVERNAVRNLVPFYSWYKAIATIAYKLQVDHPVRALILARLGVIGDEDVKRALGALPSYLRGVIPIGKRGPDGTQTVLSTGGMNPYATIPQVTSGFNENVQNLGLNPLVIGLLQAYGRAGQYGQDVSGARLASGFGTSFLQGLPISQLVSPYPPSTLYPKRGRKQTGLSYLGVPLKELNVPEANRRAGG